MITAIGLVICMYIGIRMLQLAGDEWETPKPNKFNFVLGAIGTIGAIVAAAQIISASQEIDEILRPFTLS